MSAYLCDPHHIGAIASYAVTVDGVCPQWMDATEAAMSIATLLANANVTSVQTRYSDVGDDLSNAPGPIGLTTVSDYVAQCIAAAVEDRHDEYSAAQIHGGISSLAYQSCEYAGFEDGPAGRLLTSLVTDLRDNNIPQEGWDL
jgi:hypothetical protein